MDYEKKYKEALERARQFSEKPYLEDSAGIVEYIFPELKESEDERIKKMLRDVISQWRTGNQAWCSDVKLIDATLAWLEKQGEQKSLDDIAKEVTKDKDAAISFLKSTGIMNENGELADEYKIEQGEQKPTDKVEPKFKVGDWITDGNITIQIEAIKNNCYLYCEDCALYSTKTADKVYHLWTIQDAKKGDILQADKCILIFDSLTKDIDGNTVVSSWYHCDTKTFYGMGTSEPDLWVSTNIVPATKEQRDLLFQKMKEAGYEWNAGEKKLEKNEQKPAWSEEDDVAVKDICDKLNRLSMTYVGNESIVCQEEIKWLKSLRPQNKWKPSDEQMNALVQASVTGVPGHKEALESLINDLKKLREE